MPMSDNPVKEYYIIIDFSEITQLSIRTVQSLSFISSQNNGVKVSLSPQLKVT